MVRAAKATDPLSLALASGAMARIVRYFAVNPEARPHVRALQRATGLGPRSVQREIDRLSTLELLRHTLEAAVLLGREVNVVTATPEDVQRRLAERNNFYRDVIAGPKQWVAGGPAALADLTDFGRTHDGPHAHPPADRSPLGLSPGFSYGGCRRGGRGPGC